MNDCHRFIAPLATRQHSLVTRRQLLDAGLSAKQVEARLRAGFLLPVYPGVYVIAGAVLTFEQRLMAAALATGGVVSHRSAAALFGLRGARRDVIEITVEGPRAPRLEGVVAHRTMKLERTRIGVVPVTPPWRILLDLPAVAPGLVEPALCDVLVRRITTLGAVVRAVRENGGSGRAGTVLLRRHVEAYLAGLAPTESPLEDAFLAVLRRYGLPEPVRQYRPEWERRRVDFAYPRTRGLIEIDGRLWHSRPCDVARDRDRDERAAAMGWGTLRVTWIDVHDHPRRLAACVAELAGILLAA